MIWAFAFSAWLIDVNEIIIKKCCEITDEMCVSSPLPGSVRFQYVVAEIITMLLVMMVVQ